MTNNQADCDEASAVRSVMESVRATLVACPGMRGHVGREMIDRHVAGVMGAAASVEARERVSLLAQAGLFEEWRRQEKALREEASDPMMSALREQAPAIVAALAGRGWIERGSYGPDHGLCWAVWSRDETGRAVLVDTVRTKKSALRALAAIQAGK